MDEASACKDAKLLIELVFVVKLGRPEVDGAPVRVELACQFFLDDCFDTLRHVLQEANVLLSRLFFQEGLALRPALDY